MGDLAPSTTPGHRALADVEQARALLLGVARLVPSRRGAPGSTSIPPAYEIEERIQALCDRITGLIVLKFPAARRAQSDRVLP